MTDDQQNVTHLDRARRIAQMQAARPRVDHNGRTIGAPSTYTYDHRGRLVSAKAGDPEPDNAA